MSLKHRAALLTMAVLVAGPVGGHDFWIEASAYAPTPGVRVKLGLRVGEAFVGEPFARRGSHLARFTALGPDGEIAVPGSEGYDPAGVLTVGAAGAWVVGYESHPSVIELDAATFDTYLLEEGFDSVRQARAEAGESEKPARERFARCAKTLLAVGGGDGPGFDRTFGCPLELVPLTDPYALAGGGEIQLRLDRRGRPLAGALVVAFHAAGAGGPHRARTGAEGRVTFELDAPGPWLIKSVDLEPADPASGADWASWWASLTFAVPAAGAGDDD